MVEGGNITLETGGGGLGGMMRNCHRADQEGDNDWAVKKEKRYFRETKNKRATL